MGRKKHTVEDLVTEKDFWKNKKVFITGHTGFKGSWLSLWLQTKGARVVGYALEPHTDPNLYTLAGIADNMVSLIGDVRDTDHLASAMTEHQPEIVFHLAAQALVRLSYEKPVDTYATNVMGTVNVLEAIRRSPSVQSAVMITSDKCYENREWWWGYREIDAMGGHDPYSSSKGCAELIIAAYRRSFFENGQATGTVPAIASTRAGNVVGGGDWAENRLIPDIVNAFMEKRPVVIRSPQATRPWQHVLEPLSGYLMLAQRLWQAGHAYSGAWNFGPDEKDAMPVEWIVDNLAALWGPDAKWHKDSGEQPHEATYLKLDCSKAKQSLCWRPRLNIHNTLEWIAEWYRAYQNNENVKDLTLRQITRYEELAH